MSLIVFEYKCRKCGYIFERFVDPKEEETRMKVCPRCEYYADKIISAVATMTCKSGFCKPPILDKGDKELDLKKKDIMGQRFDELPDETNIEKQAWDKLEKECGPNATEEQKMSVFSDHFKKNPLQQQEDTD